MIEFLLFWISGWILWMIGYYVWNVYYDKNTWNTKKLILYKGFTTGIFSWFAIIITISIIIVFWICELNDWIENKLS